MPSGAAALVGQLAGLGIAAHGRSGLGVWVPVAEEVRRPCSNCSNGAGPSVRGSGSGSATGPGIRITTASLGPDEAPTLAAALGEVVGTTAATYSG